jgi:peptidoglycan/LPS O-acetylase OafA/YrhL
MTVPAKSLEDHRHIGVLDGVRAISILLVLAGHLLPLGPKPLQLNEAAASMGMALFFILSGFLITRALREDNALFPFLVRRFARIVPLAYLFIAVVFLLFDRNVAALLGGLTFSLNYHPGAIDAFNPHLWSLCVEVQFYLVMGLIFRLMRGPAPYALLLLCLIVTALKVLARDPYSMQTQLRGDELLAGALLYLSINGAFGDHARFWRWAERWTPVLAGLLVLTCRPGTGPLDYVRAYVAALFVGSLLFTRREGLRRILCSRPMAYLARISYALYIIHVGVAAGVAAMMGTGSKLALYLVQRPITFAVSFLFAHLSTTCYEAPWIAFGRRLAAYRQRRPRTPAHQPAKA